MRAAFTAVMPVRALGDQAQAVADRLFFKTVVRIHRAGQGAPYAGLKPAGTPVGPVIPIAEEAVATGSSERLTIYLTRVLQDELNKRLSAVSALAATKNKSVPTPGVTWKPCWDSRCSHTLLEVLRAHYSGR